MFLLVCRQTRTYEKMVKFVDEHEHGKTQKNRFRDESSC